MSAISYKYRIYLIYLLLTIVTLGVFWQVRSFEFIKYDDNKYVTENEHILSGLTLNNVVWVFTNQHGGHWHPLTGLSHILDCELFGLNSGRHHLFSLLFHIVNTLLLFTVLWQMTGSVWKSAFVAALFAIHPLRIESVAWISSRKDVLSTLFWFLTTAAYLYYVKNPKVSRYVLTLVLFALGLMAKQMLVTLPFTLLLLDYWPLQRIDFGNKAIAGRLILEKIPLLVLSAVSSVIPVLAQRSAGAVISFQALGLWARVSNAIVSYVIYLFKLFVPAALAPFYPNMSPPIPGQTIAAGAILIVITAAVLVLGRRYKYLITGWFWYLGVLVPVIGIVQVGAQAYADRYTYVPLIGVTIMVVWFVPDVLAGRRYRKPAMWACSIAAIITMSVITIVQLSYWHDTIKLFEHTIAVTKPNCVAHNVLANAYGSMGQIDKSMEHARKALDIFPAYDLAHYNLAMAYFSRGDYPDAIGHWQEILRLKPDFPEVNFNLGYACELLGRRGEAMEYYRRELSLNPEHAQAKQRLQNLSGR